MLSGASPFPEEDEHELMRAHLMNPRPDISRAMTACSPLLGVALQKGLAIRPEDRFQTAEEMLAALEKAMIAGPREAPTTARASGGHPAQPRRPADLDITPRSGARRISNPSLPKAELTTDPAVPGVQPQPLGEGPSGPTQVVAEAAVSAAVRRASQQDDEEDESNARTQREGFRPMLPTQAEGFRALRPSAPAPIPEAEVDTGPREGPTGPSESHAQPLVAASGNAAAPLPVYLRPPFLVGAAVVLVVLGVLLGKLL